jgi:hypothetical protein
MRKGIAISVLTLFLAAVPADAFFFKRHHAFATPVTPFATPVIQSVIHSIANVGVVPGGPSENTSPIYVDPSVKTKIANARSNLADANSILQNLLEKNKITSGTGKTASGSATIDNPITVDSPPPLR